MSPRKSIGTALTGVNHRRRCVHVVLAITFILIGNSPPSSWAADGDAQIALNNVDPSPSTGGAKQIHSSPSQPKQSASDLPKSESELLRLLTETNRRIDELDRVSKGWSNVVGGLQEKLQSISPPTGDIDKLVADIGTAASSKNISATKVALRHLYQQFFAPVGRATFFNAFGEASESGSPSGLFNSRISADLNGILQEYYQRASAWHETGGGFGLNQFAPQSEPAFALPTPEDVTSLKTIFSDEVQKSLITAITARLNSAIKEATAARDRSIEDLNDAYLRRDQISNAIDKSKKEINGLAIQLGLPLFCGTVLLLFAIPFLALRNQTKTEPTGGQPKDFQFGTLVEISTVLLLTMSILILGLADKLDGPVLGTLLGGISGYVLNRIRDPKRGEAPPPSA